MKVSLAMHARRTFLLEACSATLVALSPICARASYSVGASTVMHPLWQTVHVERSLPARIKAISNVFETGNPQADYAYVENLNDGRGYTVTSYGFCTSTGEVSGLIRRYSMIAPDNPLKHFLAWMEPASASEERLGDFPAAWRHEASVSNRLAAVCDEEADRLYFTPAMRAAEVADMRTPVGRLVFYDTWLQHGGDGDPDSFQAIYSRTLRQVGDHQACSEQDFIRAFLKVRKAVLLNAAETATRSVWRQSAPRVDALAKLLDENPNLIPPITVTNSEISVVID